LTGIIQRWPTTSKGIIQHTTRYLQKTEKRGGMTLGVKIQLMSKEPRAVRWRQVSRAFQKFNPKQPNARHHPPRTQCN
jgi:hypothetical protein